MSVLKQKQIIQQCPCFNGFSYPYSRTLLDAIVKLEAKNELFSKGKLGSEDDENDDAFYFEPLASLLVSKLLEQIPKNNQFFTRVEDSYASKGALTLYIKAASEFLATFE